MKSEHCSEPHNPLIANILYKRKLLENWGRGISLMTEECQKANLPEPEFKLSNGFVTLIFRYGSAIPASTRQVPDKYPASTRQVTIQVEMLVQIIQKEFYSVREMMGYLQLKDRENFLNNYLNPAIKAGMVEPLYPDQPKHPRQKYRLTEKGKDLLKKGGK